MGADDSLRRQDKSNYDIEPVNRDNSARTLKKLWLDVTWNTRPTII